MSTLTLTSPEVFPTQNGLDFGKPLYEDYNPQSILDFCGLDDFKQKLHNICTRPRDGMNFLFVGPSGIGKTQVGFAMARMLNAEMHHIASRDCDLQRVNDIKSKCWYVPWLGKPLHFVQVDEADGMSPAAQDAFLSMLDGTARPPRTWFLFTANGTDKLHPRFLSRCMEFKFKPAWATTLTVITRIWIAERDKRGLTEAQKPNLQQIARDANGNVRDAINTLDKEMMGL